MSMKKLKSALLQTLFAFALLFISLPSFAQAAETAAWVPWFGLNAGADGAKSAIENIEKLDVIYLFVYETRPDGSLYLRADLKADYWQDLIETAHDNDVKVIPTIAWFDGEQIHKVLSDRGDRRKQVSEIVKMVKDGGFDGVNIDYEGKKKETKDDFSAFLKDLNKKLKDKSLTCALEARTPPESLYKVVPAKVEYSNDYKVINSECDWVEIMAYDQQRADIKLNEERKGVPYMPVADKDWVEKVIQMAVKDIDENKIMLGVPTYGRAWDVAVAPEWYRDYTRVAGLNHPRIMELSKIYKSKIGRTAGGEATISYFPKDYALGKIIQKTVKKAPKGTPKGFEPVARALKYATDKNQEVSVRFVTWSDATAIKDKLNLVNKYNLRGTAIFKVDGEEDPKIWKLFK
ncbi:MAG: glycosyl hydrolase family 18 protein [Patescibacteria group bacterium]